MEILGSAAKGVIYLTMLTLTCYSVILGYHWLSYGASKKASLTALVVFVTGCIAIILGMTVAYNFL